MLSLPRLDAKQLAFPYLEPVGSGRVLVSGARLRAGLVAQSLDAVPVSLNMSAGTRLEVDAKQVRLSIATAARRGYMGAVRCSDLGIRVRVHP